MSPVGAFLVKLPPSHWPCRFRRHSGRFVDEWHYCTKRQWVSGAAPPPAPFNTSFHLEMALAVGGGRQGYTPEDVDLSALPQRLLVDYVRISQVRRISRRSQGGRVQSRLPGGNQSKTTARIVPRRYPS